MRCGAGENLQRQGSTNRQNRPQLWFQHRRTRAALSAALRVDVAVMAAARGTPGASLVTLVTASLRDARPGGGRGEEEREGEARGRADTCISERYASGPTSAGGGTTPSPAARAPARGAREVSASSSARESAATREGPARAGEPLPGRAPPPAPAPVVHSYFATLLGATTDPGDALEMLRDAPACLRRNRLVEMKKAAKAEATRKRLHSLLEAGECLDAATFPGIASALPTHALDAATDRSTAADADSASFDDADERRRELRRLFPGGTLYVDERPRVYPMSTDDDNLAPSHTSEPGEEKGDETDAGAGESPDGESPGGGVAGETSTVVSGKRTTPEKRRQTSKRRERPNESATAAAARYRQAAAAPTSPPRTLPFLAGGIQVIRIGCVVPALSARASAQSSYVLPAGFTSRRRYTSATDPTKKVWYESTVEVRSSRQQPATNGFRGVGKKDAGKEGFVVVVHEVGNPALTWRGTSPTHAWQQVIAAVNVRAKTRKKAAVSGPQFLGLSLPEVAEEIAKLPGYAECVESMARGGTNGGGGGKRSPTNAR